MLEYKDIIRMAAVFLMQLLICEAGFLVGLPRRKHFTVRLIGSAVLFIGVVGANLYVRRILPGEDIVLMAHLKSILYFSVIVFANALAVHLSFDTTYPGALFAVIGGYSIEHAASRFSYIIKACFFATKPLPPVLNYVGLNFLIPLVFSLLSYFLLIRRSIATNQLQYNNKKVLAVSGVNLFICVALSLLEPELVADSEISVLITCASYVNAIVGCLLCLLLQVGLFRESELDEKNRILGEMLQLEREKQALSKETIDIINQKCHDLRHQIRMLERQTPEERSKSLQSIYDATRIYDSIVKTGNGSVDLVLMEKKLFCEKYDIHFSYLVDGEKFNFMDEADIYAMLGNMLDNAIESVIKESDPDKRIIHFVAHTRSGMLYINMENYCSTPIRFQDNLPETSKTDKAFHGFGTKSIVHIAESYGGTVLFQQENNYFSVEILIPLKN